jgi:hypothetical protein
MPALCFGGGAVLTTAEPVKNIATGKGHRVRLEMPEGMEYKRPEIATTGVLRSKGPIAIRNVTVGTVKKSKAAITSR